MYVSIFDLFKIGIGPSSSHTYGPMMAAYQFISSQSKNINNINQISVELFGSLAFTGKGHGTDKAIIIGLSGYMPSKVDKTTIDSIVKKLSETSSINIFDEKNIKFDIKKNMIFNFKNLDQAHPNTMLFKSYDNKNLLLKEEYYYSIGGGFIASGSDLNKQEAPIKIPYSYNSANELLDLCNKENFAIYELVLKNEESVHSDKNIKNEIMNIWSVMNKSIYNGMTNSGLLDGGIDLKRRANILYKKLIKKGDKISTGTNRLDYNPSPDVFALHPAYPNPFNPSTTIRFDIPEQMPVKLLIYDITGRLVESLFNGTIHAGYHEIQWNANQHSAGLYIVKLISSENTFTQKITLIK
tara:strand:- start:1781 stop:2842 length:1062 start_codon:yes stop_codon:yes gene_type:complete